MTHKAILSSYALLRACGLQDWSLEWLPIYDPDPLEDTPAETRHEAKTIVLAPGLGASVMRQALLHEIAHALVRPGHGHDQVWKDKALQIGCRPDYVSAFVEDEGNEQ